MSVFCRAHVYGLCLTVNLCELTAEIIDVISKFAPLKPSEPSAMFAIHQLRACTSQPIMENVGIVVAHTLLLKSCLRFSMQTGWKKHMNGHTNSMMKS